MREDDSHIREEFLLNSSTSTLTSSTHEMTYDHMTTGTE